MDPTARFSGRAGAYEKTRPSYPRAVLDLLDDMCSLHRSRVVCDLGSGTGIFARLLVDEGCTVYAVEPNDDMRRVAEQDLGKERGFHSVAGRAEATTLPDASIDLVTAAQAFHWFDVERTRREVQRILRPAGSVALIWNDRDTSATPFLRGYEELLSRFCPKYQELQGKSDATAAFDAFFGEGKWRRRSVPNEQQLGRAGLVGRVMSSSYAPLPGAPGHDELVRGLEDLFDRTADGEGARTVTITYQCVVIAGRPRD
jgi:SAM-dependent methyltransferase